MNNTVKRVWAIVMALCMVFSMVPAFAEEAEVACEHDYKVLSTLKAADCVNDVMGIDKVFCLKCEETAYVANAGHAFIEKAVDATCKANAMVAEVCGLCGDIGDIKETFEGTQLVHGSEFYYVTESEDEDAGYKPATCKEAGKGDKLCKFCDEVIEAGVVIDILDHDWVDTGVHADATCETGSGTIHVCSMCKEEKVVEYPAGVGQPALGEHDWEETVVAPTCSEKGYTYSKCKKCGEEKTENETEIDEDNHSKVLDSTLKAATCDATGIGKYVCEWCGEPQGYQVIPADHDWTVSELTEATCGEAGEIVYVCANGCKDEDGEVVTKTEVLDATGKHNFVETAISATCKNPAQVGMVCSVCGAIDGEMETIAPALKHEWDAGKHSPANCEYPAGALYVCGLCGEEKLEAYTEEGMAAEKLGHKWAATPVDVVEATCSAKGYSGDFYCERCGKTDEAHKGHETEINPEKHSNVVISELKAATCDTDGIGKFACEWCGEPAGYQVIPADHDWTVSELTEATCGKAGEIVYVCANGCKDEDGEVVTKTESIPATGKHNMVETAIEATCDEDAKVGEVCTVCGEGEDEMVVIEDSALGHKPGKEKPVDPNCVHGAGVEAVCERCGEVLFTAYTGDLAADALGHDWATERKNVVEATCSAKGYTGDIVCNRCGEVDDSEANKGQETPIDPEAHSDVLDTTLKAATCDATGIGKYVCEYCGKPAGYKVIPADHAWVEVEREDATCGEEGYVLYECINGCKDEDGEVVTKEVILDATGEHNMVETTIDATCDEDAKVGEVCTVCGEGEDEMVVIEDSALGHKPGKEKPVDPNCVHGAGAEAVCERCGEVLFTAYTGELAKPALGHDWATERKNVVAATCSAKGYTGDIVCNRCGEVDDSEANKGQETPIVPTAHSNVLDTTLKAATCDATGIGKYVCEYCGEPAGYQVIPADHAWVEVEREEATCGEEGYVLYECSNGCKDEDGEVVTKEVILEIEGEHNMVADMADATCTEPAKLFEKCSVCGYESEPTYVVGSEELGHKEIFTHMDATCDKAAGVAITCERCDLNEFEPYTDGELAHEALGHAYKTVTIAPTCEEGGYDEHVCSRCGDTYTDNETDADPEEGHVAEAGETIKENSCTATGIAKAVCKYCGEPMGYQVIPADHKWVETGRVEATCGEDGEITYVCELGCEGAEKVETIDATGEHTFVTDTIDATCTEPAYVGEVCSVCGEAGEVEQVAGSKPLGHDEVMAEDKAPTCQENGYKDRIVCNRCGEICDDGEVVVDANAHVFDVETLKEGTCAAPGIGKYTCTLCDHYEYKEMKVEHTWSEEKTDEAGTCVYKYCTVCFEIEIVEEFEGFEGLNDCVATGKHEVVVTKGFDATCGAEGLTDGETCVLCGEILVAQEVIPATGEHTPEVVPAVEATCTVDGLTEGSKCADCGEILVAQEVVAASGHTEEVIPAVAPTCKEDGLTEGVKCSVCGEILVAQEVAPATGVECTPEVIPAVPATCKEDGLTEGSKCSVCGDILVAQEVVPASGVECTPEAIPAVPATCKEEGLTEGTKCSVCGEILVAQEVVEKLAHTPAAAVKENEVKATCDKVGSYDEVVYCSVCGEEISRETITVDKTGDHAYEVSYTLSADGFEKIPTYTCTKCGDSYVGEGIPFSLN